MKQHYTLWNFPPELRDQLLEEKGMTSAVAKRILESSNDDIKDCPEELLEPFQAKKRPSLYMPA